MSDNAKICRFKLSVGAVDFECEGDEAFVRTSINELIDQVAAKLGAYVPVLPASPSAIVPADRREAVEGNVVANASTSMFAARLGARSGSDLVYAACAKLSITDGLESFTRQQIFESMKSAAAFYRASFGSNLSKYLATLVRERKLHEHGRDRYALSAAGANDISERLSQGGANP